MRFPRFTNFLIFEKMEITDANRWNLFNEARLKLTQKDTNTENPITSQLDQLIVEIKRTRVVSDVLEITCRSCHEFSLKTLFTDEDKQLFLQDVMVIIFILQTAAKRNAEWLPNLNISKNIMRWFNEPNNDEEELDEEELDEGDVLEILHYRAIRVLTWDLMLELNQLTNQLIEQLGLDKAPSDYVFFAKLCSQVSNYFQFRMSAVKNIIFKRFEKSTQIYDTEEEKKRFRYTCRVLAINEFRASTSLFNFYNEKCQACFEDEFLSITGTKLNEQKLKEEREHHLGQLQLLAHPIELDRVLCSYFGFPVYANDVTNYGYVTKNNYGYVTYLEETPDGFRYCIAPSRPLSKKAPD